MKNLQSLSPSTSSSVHAIGEVCLSLATKDALFRAVEGNRPEDLSELFAEGTVDLTAADIDGVTALHRAVALGHDAITKILIEKANNDLEVLNAVDGDTYTPLMRAAEMRNVPMMQALIAAGGRTNEDVNLYNKFCAESDRGEHTAAARMLIEVEGDISEAFELAVWSRHQFAARLYLEAGANTVPALRACVNKSGWNTVWWMISHDHIRGDEVVVVLDEARRSGNKMAVDKLTEPYAVVSTLLAMKGQAELDLARALKVFTVAVREVSDEANANDYAANLLCAVVRYASMLEHEYWDKQFEAVNVLIAAGAPVVPMFSWLIRQDDRRLQQQLTDFVWKTLAVSVAKQLWVANDERLSELGDRVASAATKNQPQVGASSMKEEMFSTV